MPCLPDTPDAYRLLHDGSLMFADMEANGMLIDTAYLDRAADELAVKLKGLREAVRSTDVYTLWYRIFGQETNIDSGEQLAHVLFKEMGLPVTDVTRTGTPSTDEDALEKIDLPFVADYLEYKKFWKLRNTYFAGIRREVCDDGRLHCFFHLAASDDKEGGATTYRPSSSDPNLQNIPIRDKDTGPLIRRAFIAPAGWRLIEIDETGAEVRAACGYHKDPTMIRYIINGYDMHKDMARECFLLAPFSEYRTPEQNTWLDECRQAAKGDFTFASFYGSFYKKISRALWDDIRKYKLKDHLGRGLYTHLAAHGIRERGLCDANRKDVQPGTFEAHMKTVEERFWKERFPVYAKWREDIVREYRQQGWMRTLTGFVITGPQSRNFIFNSPVQGSAFHWVLWAAIQIRNEIRRRRMRTQLVNLIHDSIISLAPVEEADDYVAFATHYMTEAVRQHWAWVNVPLAAKTEWSAPGGSWAEKEKRKAV